jgi:hypothetical protein
MEALDQSVGLGGAVRQGGGVLELARVLTTAKPIAPPTQAGEYVDCVTSLSTCSGRRMGPITLITVPPSCTRRVPIRVTNWEATTAAAKTRRSRPGRNFSLWGRAPLVPARSSPQEHRYGRDADL